MPRERRVVPRRSTGGRAPKIALASPSAKSEALRDRSSTDLHRAVRSGCVETVLAVLREEGTDCRAVDCYGMSALDVAVCGGMVSIVQVLVVYFPEALYNQVRDGDVLQSALELLHEPACRRWMSPVDVSQPGCCAETSLSIVRLLVSADISGELRMEIDEDNGHTSLMQAVDIAGTMAVPFLQAILADGVCERLGLLERQNDDGQTCLHLAAFMGLDEVVDFLVAASPFLMYCVDRDGFSPLSIAACGFLEGHATADGSLACVKVLARTGGAGTQSLWGSLWLKALRHAARAGAAEIARFLAERTTMDELCRLDCDGCSVLHIACCSVSERAFETAAQLVQARGACLFDTPLPPTIPGQEVARGRAERMMKDLEALLQERMLALAMGGHHRLGRQSPILAVLPQEMLAVLGRACLCRPPFQ